MQAPGSVLPAESETDGLETREKSLLDWTESLFPCQVWSRDPRVAWWFVQLGLVGRALVWFLYREFAWEISRRIDGKRVDILDSLAVL